VKPAHETDVGDFVIAVLAGSLAEVRDALAADGFDDAAELVADFVDAADHHLGGL
jgi:hypothetical protein